MLSGPGVTMPSGSPFRLRGLVPSFQFGALAIETARPWIARTTLLLLNLDCGY